LRLLTTRADAKYRWTTTLVPVAAVASSGSLPSTGSQ
jgi:hypothetical protein